MRCILHTHRVEYPKPAIFIDRDGTINVEKKYLYKMEDWEWITGAPEAIKMLRDCGYLIIVVSNQAGIARGYYTSDDVAILHESVQKELFGFDTQVDAFYWCPHHPAYGCGCSCRKPAPGMLFQAASDLNVDLASSWMLGDKVLDVQAGLNAGVKSMLVQTGYGLNEMRLLQSDVPVFTSIVEAAFNIKDYVVHAK